MRYGSVCSGIEAATAAWEPLGFQAAWFSEIEPFPCAVLAHHYPDTPNRGDMTRYKEWPYGAIDLLVGGTPCQSFSVAGLRRGLDDPRGDLMLTYGAIAAHFKPRWLVWENVPGVLSSGSGRDFGTFIGMLGLLGYGVAYRVLDAQYFGVPQRRRRVFAIGYLGDWRRAAAVLFESESLRWDSSQGQGKEPGLAAGVQGDNTGATCYENHAQDSRIRRIDMPTIHAKAGTGGGNLPIIAAQGTGARRLTPRECERLQGFPDDYTAIPWRGRPAPDGPRYKALGNSMAVPVMRWIGRRIQQHEERSKA